jgi:opacity protein-like surface antigen
LSVAGAIGVGTRDFTLEVDGLADFTTWDETTSRWMLGGELLAADHVPIRAGYRYDDGSKAHAVSAGIGYIETTFGVELGLRRTLGDLAATTVALGFSYHLEATGMTPTATDTF